MLFLKIARKRKVINVITFRFTDADKIYINGIKYFSGSKRIIDDILTWSTNLDLILICFECVCKVFEKYHVIFRLNKCVLLKDRVEYVGHDLTPTVNVPEKSKFRIINDWKLTTSSQGLHSFDGQIIFITTTRHTLKCLSKICLNCTVITLAKIFH